MRFKSFFKGLIFEDIIFLMEEGQLFSLSLFLVTSNSLIFEDIIFVMEEVDRAGNLVRGDQERRSGVIGGGGGGVGPTSTISSTNNEIGTKNHPGSLVTGTASTEQLTLTEQLARVIKMEEALSLGDVPMEFASLCEVTPPFFVLSVIRISLTLVPHPSCEAVKKSIAEQSLNAAKNEALSKDQVDLQGLLQVFDGVVDSPGRLIVMTTNVDPSSFDPALIRPGRINWCMNLGYMKEVHVLAYMYLYTSRLVRPLHPNPNTNLNFEVHVLLEMVRHYMQVTPTPTQQALLESSLERFDFTPAAVEQLCVEVASVQELLTLTLTLTLPLCLRSHLYRSSLLPCKPKLPRVYKSINIDRDTCTSGLACVCL